MDLRKVDTIEQLNVKLEFYFGERTTKSEQVLLNEAPGRTLSQSIISDTDMPPFTRSVVDGYALRAADTFGASEAVPAFLKLTGEIHMGALSDISIQPGETAYVPTGGMLPAGADAVIMIEHTEHFGQEIIAAHKPVAPGNGVFKQGDDFSCGETMILAGKQINPKDIGVLACLGKSQVDVYRKPKVSLISTGDELVEIEKKPLGGQIRDVNSHLIAAHLERSGAKIIGCTLIKDDFKALRDATFGFMNESDILLISGGSSQGNKDMTENVIASLGAPGVFTHGLALKPGKPAIFAAVCEGGEAKLIVGLPGHPMSALVVYLAVIEPFIRRYFLGDEKPQTTLLAKATQNIHAGEGRETWQPVKLKQQPSGIFEATPIYAKSGSLYQMMQIDGFMRIPVMSEGVKTGEILEIMPFHI